MTAKITLETKSNGNCSDNCDLFDTEWDCCQTRFDEDDDSKPGPDCPLHDATPGTTREFELNPVGTAHKLKVLERALDNACHTVFGYYEQSPDNPDYKTANNFVEAFMVFAEAELAGEGEKP
jgi:hypothetical protein